MTLLYSVKSSTEQIEKLADKVKVLSHTDLEEADQSSSGDGWAKRRKWLHSYLVIQVSIRVIVMYG